MSLGKYAVKSLALREEFRASNPVLAFFAEIGRYAAVMALVLAIADLFEFTSFASTPGRRLAFIGLWSLFMATVEAVRRRATSPQSSR